MTVKRLLSELDSAEISEQMAFDLLSDKDYMDNLEMKNRSQDENSAAIMKLLGGSK